MKMIKRLSVALGLVLLAMSPPGVSAAPLDDLIAGAKKEGVIEFYGPSTLGPEGAQAICR